MRAILGDCRDALTALPTGSVDLIVTSPPYDAMRDYRNSLDDWCFETFEQIADQLYCCLKPGGVLVWNVGDATVNGGETGSSFRQALAFMARGMLLADTMIWEKTGTSMGSNRLYHQNFEYMFVLSKGKHVTFNPIRDRENVVKGPQKVGGGSIKSDGKPHGSARDIESGYFGKRNNIWRIAPAQGKNKHGHPAPFPIELARDHVMSWSNPGEVVLDPFGGSGTTALAAHRCGRRFITIERVPEYFDLMLTRLEGEGIAATIEVA